MGLFGKESSRDVARADAFKAWITARPGMAVVSLCLGVVSMLDAVTVIIGIGAGIAAVITGYRGLAQIKREPALLGNRLCVTGMVLGVLGIALSLILWLVVYPSLSRQA